MAEQRGPTTLRGTQLRHNVQAIENLYGAAVLAEIKAALSPEARHLVEHATALDAVPPEIYGEIHEALKKAVGASGWEASQAMGSEAARLEFGGVYRVLLRAVHYDGIWDRIERAWNHIVGRGGFRWLERSDGYVKGEIAGVTGFHPGIWASAAGRAERLIVMSGAKSCTVTFIETLPTRATFEAYWVP